MNQRNVILDTHIGLDIDDTWALGMLLNMPELKTKFLPSLKHPNTQVRSRQNSCRRSADPIFPSQSIRRTEKQMLRRCLCGTGWDVSNSKTTAALFCATELKR